MGFRAQEGSGEECALQKMQRQQIKNCLIHFSVYRPSLKGITIRHPPQAFPLGLLAPRLLGVLHILAFRACERVLGQDSCLGRGRNPLPSVGLLLADVIWSIQCFITFFFLLRFVASFNVPSESALAQPLSSFSYPSFSLI